MDPYKNIRRLIEAHQKLLQAHPDLQLALPGKKDGNVQAIEQWSKQQSHKNLHFLGFISDNQLRWLYESTRAYTLASMSEGFGLGGLEAMSYGSPLVSSNATCLPEVYKDGAHYFDPLSVEDMAAKINDVLTDQNLRNQLIAEGKKVTAGYSWKKMAEETLAAYRQATGTEQSN
jgi:glycosyltransferase involved in cell wall biosynthesis